MALVRGAGLAEIIVEGGESAKSLNRPGMTKLLAMVDAGKVKTVIVAKLDRLTRSVKDLCELLERFERRSVALVSVAESLDTGSAAGRLVLNIMAAVSQWEQRSDRRTYPRRPSPQAQPWRAGWQRRFSGFRLAADGQHLGGTRRAGGFGRNPAAAPRGATLRGIAVALNHRGPSKRVGVHPRRLESVARALGRAHPSARCARRPRVQVQKKVQVKKIARQWSWMS